MEINIKRYSRPFYVTLIIFGVLLFIVVPNLIRMVQAIIDWQFLVNLLPISPFYLVMTGAVWGIGGLIVAVGLWQGRPRMRSIALWGGAAYVLYYWIDRLLLRSSSLGRSNETFVIAVSIIFVGLLIFALTRPRVKLYFGETHEQ